MTLKNARIASTQIEKKRKEEERPFRINFTLPGRPSSALGHSDVVEYSEVADSVHARTCSNEKTADMDGLRCSPDDPYYRPGLSIRVSMFEYVRLVTGTSS